MSKTTKQGEHMFTVSKNGKPFTDYTWDEKAKTFSSDANGLVIDMSDMSEVTVACGWESTVTCGWYSTVKCGWYSTVTCGGHSTVKCGRYSTVTCGVGSTITCGECSTVTCGVGSTITCGECSTVKAEGEYVVVTRRDCQDFFRLDNQTIKTNSYRVVGYEVVEPKKIITIDGKDIEISKESYDSLVAGLVKAEWQEESDE
jgi:hypothetical protein